MNAENRTERSYAHGYERVEQDRLVAQARYWSELLLEGSAFHPGERVLEIGCGVGAVLGLYAQAFPNVQWCGIDLAEEQIAYARDYLRTLGFEQIELRTGNAATLPWEADTFDHVYAVWLIEHLHDPESVLREAKRMLKPGGTIRLMETDYLSMRIGAEGSDYERFLQAFVRCFDRYGDSRVGIKLGRQLEAAGFRDVENRVHELDFQSGQSSFRKHVDYLSEFLDPMLSEIASLDADPPAVHRGYEAFRREPDRPQGSMTHAIYRAFGRK